LPENHISALITLSLNVSLFQLRWNYSRKFTALQAQKTRGAEQIPERCYYVLNKTIECVNFFLIGLV